MQNPLRHLLQTCPRARKRGVLLLDGGLTTSLPKGAEKHFLWGHQLLYGLDGGISALKDVHGKFLRAGSDVISTLSYKLSAELIAACYKAKRSKENPLGMMREVVGGRGRSEGEMDIDSETQNLFNGSAEAARQAIEEEADHVVESTTSGSTSSSTKNSIKRLVFGSVGPCVDATELFRGATDPNTRSKGNEEADRMKHYYEKKLRMLKKAGVDGVFLETLAGSVEATIGAEISGRLGLSTVVSFCCKDSAHTNSGEALNDCAKRMREYSHVHAVGVNCVKPELAVQLVKTLKAALHDTKLIAVYPNSGEVWDATEGARCWHGADKMKVLDGSDCLSYKEAGADLIGGCCRVTPEQIRLFAAALDVGA
ncbi:unnamed protein product [Amoebophrya sp. A25]|nr:unnamed protein product [Amoebophrya sp. A25]|eukprot:GSA25T00017353001.1